MHHYLLWYEIGPDYLERRGEYRMDHLRLAKKYADDGLLIAGGTVDNPLDTALILFCAEAPGIVEEFARIDPYVTSGIVKSWSVREWKTVAGPLAVQPVPIAP